MFAREAPSRIGHRTAFSSSWPSQPSCHSGFPEENAMYALKSKLIREKPPEKPLWKSAIFSREAGLEALAAADVLQPTGRRGDHVVRGLGSGHGRARRRGWDCFFLVAPARTSSSPPGGSADLSVCFLSQLSRRKIAPLHRGFSGGSSRTQLILRHTIMPFSSGKPLCKMLRMAKKRKSGSM